MALWCETDSGTNAIRRYVYFAGTSEPIPKTLPAKAAKWLIVENTQPPYDPATEVIEGPVVNVLVDKVTRVWSVRAKTAPELDADKAGQVQSVEEAIVKGFQKHENDIRRLLGQAQVDETQVFNALKSYIGASPPAPGANNFAVLRDAGGPGRLLVFTASVTIGALTAAAFTDKTFTIPGLLTTDVVLAVIFTAGLLPATISYTPLRVSAADTLAVRFGKISTGAVTPPAPQAMTVLVVR